MMENFAGTTICSVCKDTWILNIFCFSCCICHHFLAVWLLDTNFRSLFKRHNDRQMGNCIFCRQHSICNFAHIRFKSESTLKPIISTSHNNFLFSLFSRWWKVDKSTHYLREKYFALYVQKSNLLVLFSFFRCRPNNID